MLVDCGTCTVRGHACQECVVTVLWGLPENDVGVVDAAPAGALRLDRDDRAALRALADAGMVPRLRHEHGADERPGAARRRAAG